MTRSKRKNRRVRVGGFILFFAANDNAKVCEVQKPGRYKNDREEGRDA